MSSFLINVILLLVIRLLFSSFQFQRPEPAQINQANQLAEIRGRVSVPPSTLIDEDSRHDVLFDRYNTHRPSRGGSVGSVSGSVSHKISERSAVYLEGEPLKGKKYLPPTNRPVMDQKDLAFHPQVLPVVIGTTVEFPNRDNLFHNVFSYSQPKDFDLGRYPTGESRFVRFDRAGVVRVYCDIHSHMNAIILVLDHPYFSTVNDDGEYAISNIPPGTYTLNLWYGREVVAKREIAVKNGDKLTINLSY